LFLPPYLFCIMNSGNLFNKKRERKNERKKESCFFWQISVRFFPLPFSQTLIVCISAKLTKSQQTAIKPFFSSNGCRLKCNLRRIYCPLIIMQSLQINLKWIIKILHLIFQNILQKDSWFSNTFGKFIYWITFYPHKGIKETRLFFPNLLHPLYPPPSPPRGPHLP
jgi:hypothetical protein